MTCRSPLQAAWNGVGKPKIFAGDRPRLLLEGYRALELPCGQCKSCRLEKKRQWANRLMLEAAYWEDQGIYPFFLTLTYDDENIDIHHSLVPEDVQLFWKRLRNEVNKDARQRFGTDAAFVKLRYYVSGEYGSQCPNHELIDCPMCGPLQRPHYHAIVFGWTPTQTEVLGHRDGMLVRRSEIIEKAWGMGDHEIGTCTYESCAYVAKYVQKKITGDKAEDHYIRICPYTGEFWKLQPEFAMMSKGGKHDPLGGIGKPAYDQFKDWWYIQDEVPIPGRTNVNKPGKYFDTLYAKENPKRMEAIKEERRKAMATSLIEGPSLKSRADYQDGVEKFFNNGAQKC